MSWIQAILILCTVILLSIGQIVFKLAAADVVLDRSEFLYSLFSLKSIAGFAVYTAASVLWIISIKDLELSIAYPFAALAFLIVPILSYFILDESVSWNTFAGGAFIILGVIISMR
jgi:drug/metabolite transporter (DMT)-like permease